MSAREEAGMTEEEWDSLSDEERSALDTPESELPGTRKEDRVAPVDDDAPAVEDAVPVVELGKEKPAAEVAAEVTKPAAEDIAFTRQAYVPIQDVGLTGEIKAASEDLSRKHDEGELTTDEYFTQRESLSNKARDEFNTGNRSTHEWGQDVGQFMAAGNNAMFREEGPLRGALDSEVMRIASAEATLSGPEVLKQARESIVTTFKLESKEETPGVKPKATRPEAKTLGGLPAAEAPGVGADEFAALDLLDGLELESAVAKMSNEQQDRYERGA